MNSSISGPPDHLHTGAVGSLSQATSAGAAADIRTPPTTLPSLGADFFTPPASPTRRAPPPPPPAMRSLLAGTAPKPQFSPKTAAAAPSSPPPIPARSSHPAPLSSPLKAAAPDAAAKAAKLQNIQSMASPTSVISKMEQASPPSILGSAARFLIGGLAVLVGGVVSAVVTKFILPVALATGGGVVGAFGAIFPKEDYNSIAPRWAEKAGKGVATPVMAFDTAIVGGLGRFGIALIRGSGRFEGNNKGLQAADDFFNFRVIGENRKSETRSQTAAPSAQAASQATASGKSVAAEKPAAAASAPRPHR